MSEAVLKIHIFMLGEEFMMTHVPTSVPTSFQPSKGGDMVCARGHLGHVSVLIIKWTTKRDIFKYSMRSLSVVVAETLTAETGGRLQEACYALLLGGPACGMMGVAYRPCLWLNRAGP